MIDRFVNPLRTGKSIDGLLPIGGALLAAMVLRAGLILKGVVPFNADEAIVALMARNILTGGRPIFFYGQAYMGSLDAYLAAIGFALFGEHVWVVRGLQILLCIGTILASVMIVWTITHSVGAMAIVAWLLAVPSVNLVLYTTVSLGGYGELLLIGNLILLLSLRIANKIIQDAASKGVYLWFGLGFLIGLGLWSFGFSLVYALPAVGYLVWFRSASVKRARTHRSIESKGSIFPALLAALAGSVLGAIPWLIYAGRLGSSTLVGELAGGAIAGVEGLGIFDWMLRRMFNLLILGGTVVTGLRPPWEIRWLAIPLAPLVFSFWIVVLIIAIKITKREIGSHKVHPGLALDESSNAQPAHSESTVIDVPGEERGLSEKAYSARPRLNRSRKIERDLDQLSNPKEYTHSPLFAGVLLTLAAGFFLTPFGADPSGRYFLPFSVILAIFAAVIVWTWQRNVNHRAWLVVLPIILFNLWGVYQSATKFPPGLTTQFDKITQIDHRYDDELINFLRMNGEKQGFTNYWVAYPLAFLTDEELIYLPKLPYHQDFRYTPRDNRYEPYELSLQNNERAAYITTNNLALDEYLRHSFSVLDVAWEETLIGDYHIFYQLSRRVDPEEIGLGIDTQ